LVVENGDIDDSAPATIPYFANFVNTAIMYSINSAPEPRMGNRSFPVRVGNAVGGSSVVNGMQFDRGAAADYDAWEELGAKGWGWKGLEPYFKKTFRFTPPSEETQKTIGVTYDQSAFGNDSAPIAVSIPTFQYPDYRFIFDAWRTYSDIPIPKEGFADPIGAYWTPNTINNATSERTHARKAYYDQVKFRKNLKLLVRAHVDEILFDTSQSALTANGIKISSNTANSTTSVYAAKEVILAAGGIFTPHLLMFSGIGPKAVLNAAKVRVKLDLPGVGSNFQDHVPAYMSFNLSNMLFPNTDSLATNTSYNASAATEYEKSRSGPWSAGRANALSMVTLKQISAKFKEITQSVQEQEAQYLPERYTWASGGKELYAGYVRQRDIITDHFLRDDAATGEFPIYPSGRTTLAIQKPLSRGWLALNTTHPSAHPIVAYNALSNPIDKLIIAEMTRFNRRHWAKKELERYAPKENVPGAQYQTDDEIIEGFLKANQLNPSFSHHAGGASMLPRELGGVVGADLKVYGVGNLTIVDASIIPLIPSTHLQATMYVIGEKAADIINSRALS
jgi:choline dehydrogenase-like flavoprotein